MVFNFPIPKTTNFVVYLEYRQHFHECSEFHQNKDKRDCDVNVFITTLFFNSRELTDLDIKVI